MKRLLLLTLIIIQIQVVVSASIYDGVDKEIIKPGRNLGIGNDNPNKLMVVNGNGAFQSSVLLKETVAPSQEAGYGKIYTGTDSNLYFLDDSNISHIINEASIINYEWYDRGTYLHPADNSGQETVVIGNTDTSNGDIILGHNGNTIINEQGLDSDTRIEGDTNENLFFTDASTNRIGIGTNSPSSKLEINGTLSATVFLGNGSGLTNLSYYTPFIVENNIVSNNGAASLSDGFIIGAPSYQYDGDASHHRRMFFETSKGNFRAGYDLSAWHDVNRVNGSSLALNYSNRAKGANSLALGLVSTSTGKNTTSFGYIAEAHGNGATAHGDGTIAAIGNYSTSWGFLSTTNGDYSTLWGYSNGRSNGENSTAWGRSLGSIEGANSTAWGYQASTGNNGNSTAINSESLGRASTSIGNAVKANQDYSIAIGNGNNTSDQLVNNEADSLIIGFNSNAATLTIESALGGSTTGNIGIGVQNPSSVLDVNGLILSTSNFSKTLITTTVNVNTATVNIDWNSGNQQYLDLKGNVTNLNFTDPSGPGAVELIIINNGASARTITNLDSDIRWTGGSYSGITAQVDAIDLIQCEYSGTNYFCTHIKNFQRANNADWVTGAYGACLFSYNSATYAIKRGYQTRTVNCQDTNTGTTIADGFCLTSKPATESSCDLCVGRSGQYLMGVPGTQSGGSNSGGLSGLGDPSSMGQKGAFFKQPTDGPSVDLPTAGNYTRENYLFDSNVANKLCRETFGTPNVYATGLYQHIGASPGNNDEWRLSGGVWNLAYGGATNAWIKGLDCICY